MEDASTALVTLPWLGWGGRPWPLRLADGQPLEWAATGRLDREFVFRSPDGRALVRFTRALLEQQYRPDGRRELWVAVTENGRALRELPLLVLLGRYLAR